MNEIETTGFGREDGGCLGAPFHRPSLSTREKNKTSHDILIQVPLQGALNRWVGYGSYLIIPNLLMLLFSILQLLLRNERLNCHKDMLFPLNDKQFGISFLSIMTAPLVGKNERARSSHCLWWQIGDFRNRMCLDSTRRQVKTTAFWQYFTFLLSES